MQMEAWVPWTLEPQTPSTNAKWTHLHQIQHKDGLRDCGGSENTPTQAPTQPQLWFLHPGPGAELTRSCQGSRGPRPQVVPQWGEHAGSQAPHQERKLPRQWDPGVTVNSRGKREQPWKTWVGFSLCHPDWSAFSPHRVGAARRCPIPVSLHPKAVTSVAGSCLGGDPHEGCSVKGTAGFGLIPRGAPGKRAWSWGAAQVFYIPWPPSSPARLGSWPCAPGDAC
uniref:Uncharacterized protein n=1 Tax=Nomascus leucogenys TaxID=61853 RepID=G1RRX5_NOMLE